MESNHAAIIFRKMMGIREDLHDVQFIEKINALFELLFRCDYYFNKQGYYGPIVEGIAECKGTHILAASNKQQIARALRVSEIYYNYSEVLPRDGEYHCIEEELIGWMQAASKMKIGNEAAIARITLVWDKCRNKYPALPDINLKSQ